MKKLVVSQAWILIALALTAACGGGGAVTSGLGSAHPQLITEFSIPGKFSDPMGIAVGQDGMLWFADNGNSDIGRISTGGALLPIFRLQFPPNEGPQLITKGPDGNTWFTETASPFNIGKITSTGSITTYSIPMVISYPGGITAGPDGNVWFTDYVGAAGNGVIGRITPSGAVTEFAIPTQQGLPAGIVTGPDGNLWFAEALGNKIGRITPSGSITEFDLPSNIGPSGITVGPDGNLWFTETNDSKHIAKMTLSGTVTEFEIPNSVIQGVFGTTGEITTGSDGNVWFVDSAPYIGRITPSGTVTVFDALSWLAGGPGVFSRHSPVGITGGPDGNIWFTDRGDSDLGVPAAIGKLDLSLAR